MPLCNPPASLFPRDFASSVFLKQTFSPVVYLTLVPIVVGVGLIFVNPIEFGVSPIHSATYHM